MFKHNSNFQLLSRYDFFRNFTIMDNCLLNLDSENTSLGRKPHVIKILHFLHFIIQILKTQKSDNIRKKVYRKGSINWWVLCAGVQGTQMAHAYLATLTGWETDLLMIHTNLLG